MRAASTAPETEPAPDAPAPRPTPMMEQYIEIKAANPDCLLFYRMGDFFEMFFEDAELASRALGITLTRRGKHLGQDIPMCGVPVDRADDYLQRLIAAGHRVAVCEQLEDPAEARKRGGRSVVRRDVVRLVTPGTITEDALLDPRRSNLLLAVVRVRTGERDDRFGLAWIDLSTGSFMVGESDRAHLGAEIARLDPAEIVVGEALRGDPDLRPVWDSAPGVVAPLSRDAVDSGTAEQRLCRAFAVATSEGFGQFGRAEMTAAAAVIAYLERTQLGAKAHLARPARARSGALLEIDQASRASLELTRSLSGHDAGTLLAAIDRTATAPGARLLAERLAGPLSDPLAIGRRLDAVERLMQDERRRSALRALLAQTPDLARAVQRLAVGRGGPRDLACVRDALRAAEQIADALGAEPAGELADAARAFARLAGDTVCASIGAALADVLPLHRRDGGFVRAGFEPALDEARALRDESRVVVAALQGRYVEATALRALRIKHNNLIGFFVEVPQAAGDGLRAAPFNETFVHRQTMAGAMRFSTAELVELEQRIGQAGDRAAAIEQAVFDGLASSVAERADALLAIAAAVALVDVAAGLAELAAEARWTRPLVDRSLDLCVVDGRHPVVEAALRTSGQRFVANGVDLSPAADEEPGRIWLVTGPNMGGKSTFLRQTALIVVLAQMGSYVPAASARIGVVDRLFSRVGAADDLARGRSTFMVEMVEAAAILNQATPRSFVILDEIGRGTATFDGLSIAWATIEHLHEVNRCRGLFATHFHELSALVKRLRRLGNATIKVAEYNGEVVLLHEIVPGAADRSYGIQVAKLAGLPTSVVERSRKILAELEEADRTSPVERLIDDLPLFAAAREKSEAPTPDLLGAELDAIDPDELTPKGALEQLYRLKALRRNR